METWITISCGSIILILVVRKIINLFKQEILEMEREMMEYEANNKDWGKEF